MHITVKSNLLEGILSDIARSGTFDHVMSLYAPFARGILAL